jgi:predicted DNA-binding protein
MSEKKQTAFRIPKGLLQRLKAESKRTNDSMCKIVSELLNKHLPV